MRGESRLQLQGTAVAIDGRAVLLRGPSGAGKSSLALRLIEDGAVLIADDLCELRRSGDRLLIDLPAAVDPRFRGAIERRGRGIERHSYFGPAPLVLVVDLQAKEEGSARKNAEFLGLVRPLIVLDPFLPGAVATLRKMALPGLVE